MRNIVNEVLPFRLSPEKLQGLLNRLNNELQNNIIETKKIDTGFVELEQGTRYAIQTFYGEKVFDLKKLEQACIDFTFKLINKLDRHKRLYVRKEIDIYYHNPSHMDPYTFDYVATPSRGYWRPYCRIRQPGHEILGYSREGEFKRQII